MLDIDAAREYVTWLDEKLEAEELVELERRAAGGFREERHANMGRSLVAARLLHAQIVLDKSEPLSRHDELTIEEILAYLQPIHPWPAHDAWEAFLADHDELASLAALAAPDTPQLVDVFAVDLSPDRVHSALRAAAAAGNGATRARDVAIELVPEAVRKDLPSRQILIAKVGKVIRQLEAQGLALRVRAVTGTGSCRWSAA